MIAFFDACHIEMWEVVEQGDYIPHDDAGREIPKGRWNENQKQIFMLNSKARNPLLCALTEEEYTKVHSFKSAKQMWDILAITYEGSLEVKRNKLSLLVRKYELFKMEENKSIQTMFGRFQTIVNELSFLGRTYDNFDHIDKLLPSLPDGTTWRWLMVLPVEPSKTFSLMRRLENEVENTLKKLQWWRSIQGGSATS
uniref:Retrovirus-related Pol polyprotein from transposon TNT 1-94 n=1 Tax=Cajanus cajan TaxID=3821 RepID=A0A151QMR3_CAJCA|nr:hypothetical protein KK1_048052 [Cajanus cajan]